MVLVHYAMQICKVQITKPNIGLASKFILNGGMSMAGFVICILQICTMCTSTIRKELSALTPFVSAFDHNYSIVRGLFARGQFFVSAHASIIMLQSTSLSAFYVNKETLRKGSSASTPFVCACECAIVI